MNAYLSPVLLQPGHRVGGFRSEPDEQGAWLREHARQSHAGGSTKVLVVTERGRPDVVAYYAWCMAGVAPADAPERLTRGSGRHTQPVALLARLAVDSRHEGRGLGSSMLRDVMLRTVAAAEGIGCRGLLIHCADRQALDFYRRCVPGLEISPTDPLHLVVLAKDLRRALRAE